jgi:hypothetical protein
MSDSALATPHSFAGGVKWALTGQGVSIDGAPPQGTPGEPVTAKRVLGWYGDLLEAVSQEFSVPPALLAAVICTESAAGAMTKAAVDNARRQEPGYVSDESTPGRVSIGCCQTLLSTAQEMLGTPGLKASDLTDPRVSIRAAASYLANHARTSGFDPPLVAACYNAGSLYIDSSPANRWKLRCYPAGTGAYIDRFVCWYNDVVGIERSLVQPPVVAPVAAPVVAPAVAPNTVDDFELIASGLATARGLILAVEALVTPTPDMSRDQARALLQLATGTPA